MGERPQRRTRRSGEGSEWIDAGQQALVMRRVVEQQDDEINAAIPALQRKGPLERLEVRDVRLGFDANGPPGAGDRCIPGTLISDSREIDHRHLRSPDQRRSEPSTKAAEKRRVSGIAQRRPTRIRSTGQVQPDQRGELGKSDHADVPDCAPTDPADVLTGYAKRSAELRAAQASINTGDLHLSARLVEEAPSVGAAAVDGPGPTRHAIKSGDAEFSRPYAKRPVVVRTTGRMNWTKPPG